MKLLNLTYTQSKSEVIAPPNCLFVVDLWIMSNYLFVLYIKSPVYFRFIERFNADRMVRLLKKYGEIARKKEALRKIEEEVNKSVDEFIKNANNRKKPGKSIRRTSEVKS